MAPRASTPPAGAASRLRRAPSLPFARFSRTASIAPSSTTGNRANANPCATATSAAATTSTEKEGYAMLSHPTHERLISLGLPGMAKAFEDQRRSPDIAALSFEEAEIDRHLFDRIIKNELSGVLCSNGVFFNQGPIGDLSESALSEAFAIAPWRDALDVATART